MIKDLELFSEKECEELEERILRLEGQFYSEFPGSYLRCLGYPIYLTCLQKVKRDPQEIKKFNQLMESKFQDVLKKLIQFMEIELGETVYLDPEVAYPGFHVIKVPGLEKAPANFHQDTEYTYLAYFHPHLKVLKNGPYLSFTSLLSKEESLISGLHYLNDPKLTHEYLISHSDRETHNRELLQIASFHKYQRGRINLHTKLAHTLYGENRGQEERFRISLQGHVIKTDHGYLLYW